MTTDGCAGQQAYARWARIKQLANGFAPRAVAARARRGAACAAERRHSSRGCVSTSRAARVRSSGAAAAAVCRRSARCARSAAHMRAPQRECGARRCRDDNPGAHHGARHGGHRAQRSAHRAAVDQHVHLGAKRARLSCRRSVMEELCRSQDLAIMSQHFAARLLSAVSRGARAGKRALCSGWGALGPGSAAAAALRDACPCRAAAVARALVGLRATAALLPPCAGCVMQPVHAAFLGSGSARARLVTRVRFSLRSVLSQRRTTRCPAAPCCAGRRCDCLSAGQ
jgi:hypothetical protein